MTYLGISQTCADDMRDMKSNSQQQDIESKGLLSLGLLFTAVFCVPEKPFLSLNSLMCHNIT